MTYQNSIQEEIKCRLNLGSLLTNQNSIQEEIKCRLNLGSLLRNENSIQEEIECRLKAGNSCYRSVQTLLSYWISSKTEYAD